jgi:hypothetical protein
MGAFAAGLLAVVPILVALGESGWGSPPAITIYLLTAGVLLLWFYQVHAAGDVERELKMLESYTSTGELEERDDFMLEEVNAYAIRHRLVQRILFELDLAADSTADEALKMEFRAREKRYQEILNFCETHVRALLDNSANLVSENRRTQEDHDELVDWAAAIPGLGEDRD